MTTPQGPQGPHDPWARPPNQGPPPPPGPAGQPRRPLPPPDEPTQHIPRPGSPMDGPTQQIRRPGPIDGPTQHITQPGTQPIPPAGPQPDPRAAPAPAGPPPSGPPPKAKRRFRLRDPRSILLIIVIVLALVIAGVIGAEWYVRNTANKKIKWAAACMIKDEDEGETTEDMLDDVTVKVSSSPPVLWQYLNDDYTKFTIITHGTHLRSAQGMEADIVIEDVVLNGDANKKGTIGAIHAAITWTTDGMRQSMNDALKKAIDEYTKGNILSFLNEWMSDVEVVTGVKTDPSAGTLTVEGIFDSSIVVKPETTADGGIRLVIQPDGFKLGGDLDMPQDYLQEKLDEKTGKLTENKLNIRTDSIEVKDDGVAVTFSTTNADIPKGETDPCFAEL